MSVHPDDGSVLEASCGCLLAGALGNEAGPRTPIHFQSALDLTFFFRIII